MKALVILSAFLGFQAVHAGELKSVYSETEVDCVQVVGASNDAPIDFYTAECKAFGGYVLKIAGGDLRYSPNLFYAGQQIELATPGTFHDVSDKVEWVYAIDVENEKIDWKGLIYRLKISDGEGANKELLYAVRLDGAKSCLIGTTTSNVKARELVANSKADCQ